jgi:hypothetical protein
MTEGRPHEHHAHEQHEHENERHAHDHHDHHEHDHERHAHDHHSHEHHDHEHDHGDAHSHATIDEYGISVMEHEGALVASLSLDIPGGHDAAEKALAAKLEALAQAVAAEGGVVGHIKASLAGEISVSTLSTTGGAVRISRGSGVVNHADVVAIVLAINEPSLRAALKDNLL